jgi:hypothetical protein
VWLRTAQIQSEFPHILPIRESLIKFVFEPNAAKVRGGRATREGVVSCAARALDDRLAGRCALKRPGQCLLLTPTARHARVWCCCVLLQKDEVRAAVKAMRGR